MDTEPSPSGWCRWKPVERRTAPRRVRFSWALSRCRSSRARELLPGTPRWLPVVSGRVQFHCVTSPESRDEWCNRQAWSCFSWIYYFRWFCRPAIVRKRHSYKLWGYEPKYFRGNEPVRKSVWFRRVAQRVTSICFPDEACREDTTVSPQTKFE